MRANRIKIYKINEIYTEFVFMVVFSYIPMWKTIKISDNLKKKLDKLKIHPRQSYGEVIGNLIENAKESKV